MFPDPPKLDYATPQPRRKPLLRLVVGFFGVLMGIIALYWFTCCVFAMRSRYGERDLGVLWGLFGLVFAFMSVRWCRTAIKGPPE